MDHEQTVLDMSDEDMKEIFLLLLSNMRAADLIQLLEEHLDDRVAEELFNRWSRTGDPCSDGD